MYRTKEIVSAYHCSRCGGIASPNETLCPYCSQELDKWWQSIHLNKPKVWRVVANDVYLNSVVQFSDMYTTPHEIEVATLSDNTRTYVYGIRDDSVCTIELMYTRHTMEQMDFIDRQQGSLRFEFLNASGDDRTFEAYGYFNCKLFSHEVGEIMKATLEFKPDKIIGWKNLMIPETLTCPNCGAKINSRYGCCDYCGGWVEWVRKE